MSLENIVFQLFCHYYGAYITIIIIIIIIIIITL